MKFFITPFRAEKPIFGPYNMNKSYDYGKIKWLLNEHGIANASRDVGNFYKKLSLVCNFAIQYLGWLAIPYNLEKANWMSKEIRLSLFLLCDWFRKLASLPQLIRCKTQTVHDLSPAFSRSSGSLIGFTLSCHWLLKLFFFLLVGRCDWFCVGFTTFNRDTRSKQLR